MSMVVLEVPDVPGESQIMLTGGKKLVDKIVCDSLSHEMSLEMEVTQNARRTFHIPKVENFTIERKWDLASVKLIQLMLTGKVKGPWKIYCLKAAGEEQYQWEIFLTITLVNPLLAKHSQNVSEGDTTESLEINATNITWEYVRRSETQANVGGNHVTYDVLTGEVK